MTNIKKSGGNTVYPNDMPVILSGADFTVLRTAFEEILNTSNKGIYPYVFKYFCNEKQDYISKEEVTQEDLNSRKVIQVIDNEKTFNDNNIKYGIDADIVTPLLKEAYLTLMTRLEIDANAGKTITMDEFKQNLENLQNGKPNSKPKTPAFRTE